MTNQPMDKIHPLTTTGRRWLLLATLLLAIVSAVGAMAAPGDGRRGRADRWDGPQGGRPGRDARHERLVERLDLTDEQQAALTKLQEEGRERDKDLRQEMLRLRNELEGEWLKDDPADKAVLALTRKLGVLRTKMRENHVRDRLAMREMLTEEQRDKLPPMGGRHGRRGGGGGQYGGKGGHGACGRDCHGGGRGGC